MQASDWSNGEGGRGRKCIACHDDLSCIGADHKDTPASAHCLCVCVCVCMCVKWAWCKSLIIFG